MNPEELRNDAELKAKIEKAQSLAEVVEIFREKGIEITETELSQLLTAEQELGEEELETAAGGIMTFPTLGVRAVIAAIRWLQSRGGGRGAAGGGGGMGGR